MDEMDEMDELIEAVLEAEGETSSWGGGAAGDGLLPLSTVGELPALPQWA